AYEYLIADSPFHGAYCPIGYLVSVCELTEISFRGSRLALELSVIVHKLGKFLTCYRIIRFECTVAMAVCHTDLLAPDNSVIVPHILRNIIEGCCSGYCRHTFHI